MELEDKIRQGIGNTLDATDFGIGRLFRGKVRDNYILGNRRAIVTTDRISAFDVVLGTIPLKGQTLNQMSAFWFDVTRHAVPNHMISVPDPNVMIVRECEPLPVEMVVRAYVTGVTSTSIWTHYQKGVRNFCGNLLPDGLRKDQKLAAPILTQSTKAEKGLHDESVSRKDILERKLVSEEDFDAMAEASFKLFGLGTKIAARQGLILVDTKYEFGKDSEGKIVVIDEVHTPDSSRFWYASDYEPNFAAGKEQRRIDKEYVRKWYADRGFTGDGIPPPMTDEVKVEAAKRYIEAFETITGQKFVPQQGNVKESVRQALERFANGSA